jgi:DNA-binding NarL/FixJ family response regulator
MPEMDGMEFCEEVRRRADLRHIPLIVTSTHRDAAYVIRALQRAANG